MMQNGRMKIHPNGSIGSSLEYWHLIWLYTNTFDDMPNYLVIQDSIRRAHTISGKLSSKEYRRKIPFLKGVHKGARANSERQNLRHVNEADKVHCEKDTATAGADACHSSKDREMHYTEDAATPGIQEVKHSKKAPQVLLHNLIIIGSSFFSHSLSCC